MRAAPSIVVGVAMALAIAGCGGGPATVATAPSQSAGAVLPGGGLSVAEAISTDADPPLAVGGWVVGSGDDARLCSGYNADASKPCTEPSLALEGAGSETSGTQVSLLGAVEGDTFVVSTTVQG
jgi:hypothetical protein